MCGIAGAIGFPLQAHMHERLQQALAHRGPDDRGAEEVEGALLVHTRLSILDLSCAGHQPMAERPHGGSPRNRVVFNGEIYNYRELHAPLAATGLPCASRSDTEVILNGYRAWGDGLEDRLRGMWAYCLVDAASGVAHLSRDRLGIKPLYTYRHPDGGLLFASEVRALLALGPEIVPPVADPASIEAFLAQGAVPGDHTIIAGMRLLPAATTLTVELATGREVRRRTYWRLPEPAQETEPRDAAVERVGAVMREALQQHFISDVPVGLFLSGGIDSAALLALASESNPEGVRTLNVGFDIPEFDESAPAALMAARFGAHHTEVRLTSDGVVGDLPLALAAMDQPTIDGLNVFTVSRATRAAGLTVALSGLGSDELFGGYSSFREVPRAVRLRRRLPLSALAPLMELARPDRAGMKLAELLRRPADALGIYLLRREVFLPDERRAVLALPAGVDPLSGLRHELLAEERQLSGGLDPVTQVSLWELRLYMRHMLLRDGDAFSMAASIEYRVPFLDHRLVEEVFRLPGPWKIPDPRPKPLLLDLVGKGKLPPSVWEAPKRGFSLPWGSWFSPGGPLERAARDAAHDDAVWLRLGMRPSGVRSLWSRFRAGDKRVWATQVLALVALRDYAERHRLRS